MSAKTAAATEATFKQVGEALWPVVDPEIHISIVDLGLVYGAEFGESPKGRCVKVRMSLTSPACPVAGTLPGEVELDIRQTPGVGRVTLELTWDPPFSLDMVSEDVKLMLGLI